MRLSLHNVVPLPLREKVNAYSSGIWTRELELSKGESVFVQAPSGTGKTTLIHILYGLRRDFEGKVNWDINDMSAIGSEGLSNLRANYLSVIYQDMRLFPGLTAWENLEVKRRLTDTATEQQVDTWLARLGMKDKRDALASTLSYGEQQRIAIIRSLLQPFEWLLMDEPFSHLDSINRNKAIELIAEVVRMNSAGMILADLDENEYFPYSRRIWL